MTKVSTFLIRQQIKKCRCELVVEGPQNYFLVVELNARSNTQGYPQKKTLIRGLASFQMAKVIILQKMKKKNSNCREPLLENKCTIIFLQSSLNSHPL